MGAATIASSARGDVRVIAAARRRVNRLAADRASRITKQASALVRRALEIGDWDWDACYDADGGELGMSGDHPRSWQGAHGA